MKQFKVGLWIMLLLISFSSKAQLPECNKVYFKQIDHTAFQAGIAGLLIYTFDPALPVSNTNPSLNTTSILTPSPTFFGLAISKVLGSTNTTRTFYSVSQNGNKIWYYDPVSLTWINTGHSSGPGAINLAAGGNYLYALNGDEGKIYKYDGTGDATLLVTLNDIAHLCTYDLIADCLGDFYVLKADDQPQSPGTPYLRKYSPQGVLIQQWTVNWTFAPTGITDAGFAIIGNTVYLDNGWNRFSIGTLSSTSLTMNSETLPFPVIQPLTGFDDLASCDMAIPLPPSTITIAASDTQMCQPQEVTFWTTNVTNAGNTPQYQWFINGNPVAGATDTFYTYTPQNGDVITCQLITNLCVDIATVTSNAITITVGNAIQPILSYNPNEFCTDFTAPVLPIINTSGGSFSSTTGMNINAQTGEITPSLCTPGEYVITYTNPPSGSCPQYSDTATIDVYPPAVASIEPFNIIQPACLDDTIVLHAVEASGNIYDWSPLGRIIGVDGLPTATVKLNKSGFISLLVQAKGGCTAKDSVWVDKGESCCFLFVPNAFSPNGDGANDLLQLPLKDVQAINNFQIFNRYGQMVFEKSIGKDEWDGTMNGKPCDVGVYYYILSYTCDNGVLMQKKGDITLLR